MSDTLIYAAGPFVVLFFVLLVASPFALVFHYLIALAERRIGRNSAVAIYCTEAIGLFLWVKWYLDDQSEAFDAGMYDGPVGFAAGMIGGFVMFFAGMLVILNGVGLWRLLRSTAQR
ncbi:hypothetical protein FZ934_13450 [Rhizobium grahamii]|uniref:Uncharacterized protein n=1 Tax=Rhizobium grahamii TaxID=1120045 RepID=A0A5Q0C5W6_9HYPH|nr:MULTISPECIES: hypothetical protein [Rhizobium]QFY61316.1 hypothetical protein FZ934_13450 [Rhizobium grahamii]QRM49534.1 hypothetical protein F3Y33_09440 [Rhizobium sp. BG6]